MIEAGDDTDDLFDDPFSFSRYLCLYTFFFRVSFSVIRLSLCVLIQFAYSFSLIQFQGLSFSAILSFLHLFCIYLFCVFFLLLLFLQKHHPVGSVSLAICLSEILSLCFPLCLSMFPFLSFFICLCLRLSLSVFACLSVSDCFCLSL